MAFNKSDLIYLIIAQFFVMTRKSGRSVRRSHSACGENTRAAVHVNVYNIVRDIIYAESTLWDY